MNSNSAHICVCELGSGPVGSYQLDAVRPCFLRDPLRSFVPCLFCYIVLPEHVRSSHSPGCGEGYSLVENHFFGSPYLSCLSPHFFLLHLISFLCPYLSSLSAQRRSLASSLRLVGRFTTPRRTKPLTSHQSMVHFFLPSDILCSTHLHTSPTKINLNFITLRHSMVHLSGLRN